MIDTPRLIGDNRLDPRIRTSLTRHIVDGDINHQEAQLIIFLLGIDTVALRCAKKSEINSAIQGLFSFYRLITVKPSLDALIVSQVLTKSKMLERLAKNAGIDVDSLINKLSPDPSTIAPRKERRPYPSWKPKVIYDGHGNEFLLIGGRRYPLGVVMGTNFTEEQ